MANKNVLLVEGKDDEHVAYALFNYHGIPRVIVVKDKEGITNILDTLEVELLASELERLGIIIDANSDPAARWQSLTNTLRNSGYKSIPNIPVLEGTIIVETGRPVVGVWLMPDNTMDGTLEHFVRFLVPEHDSLWEKAEDCVESIVDEGRLFPSQYLMKAKLHTWLAWQSQPGRPLGLAITSHYLDANAHHAQIFIGWIRDLFDV